MVQTFDEAGLPEAAELLQKAMSFFGPNFPRAQMTRSIALDAVSKGCEGPRENWDPFYEIQRRFFDAIEDGKFEAAADRYLREQCGITKLTDPMPTPQAKP
jgi:hypothetical protein